MIPFTVLITGTSLGVAGAIPPLVVGATPFFARLVETALREVDRGIIEATQSMGATTRQIITNALLPEARPGIFAAITVTAITLVSYTAMAGVVGAGGLGDLAIRFGYQRFQTDVMVVTVVMLLILVQILQTVGDKLIVGWAGKDWEYEVESPGSLFALNARTGELEWEFKPIPDEEAGNGHGIEGLHRNSLPSLL